MTEPLTGRELSLILYLTKDFYLEYVKKISNFNNKELIQTEKGKKIWTAVSSKKIYRCK